MTGMRRHLGLFALMTALSFSAQATSLDEASDLFNEGVELLNRGEDAAALEKFSAVLALDPSNEAAYELWKSTEHEVWLNILVKGGQYELIAKRLMNKAELGRAEKADDEAAIRGLLREIQGDDVIVFTPDKSPPKEYYGAKVCATSSSSLDPECCVPLLYESIYR